MKKYNVLLVDDEELALKGLKQGIDWDALGVEKVLTANNMAGAVRLMNMYEVHILLSDIEMPGGSGLDLLRWTKTHREDIACVFFTCHADFKYAQEAIRLGVRDYVLKPIPYRELKAVMERQIRELRGEDCGQEPLERTVAEEKSPVVETVRQYIMENITTDIRRQELAALVHMNSDYLSRVVKKETGMSLGDYVLYLKIELAKHLLSSTELSIVEITGEVGVSYSTYFIRLFKNKTGVTPQQYRKESQQK